jgi:hypothetical protein
MSENVSRDIASATVMALVASGLGTGVGVYLAAIIAVARSLV